MSFCFLQTPSAMSYEPHFIEKYFIFLIFDLRDKITHKQAFLKNH